MAQTRASVTSVAASTSAVTLFTATTGEDALGRMIYNDSTADLYVKAGAGASTTSFTVKLPAAGYYELPAPVFDGPVTGVWSAANGAARCTQIDL